ncbi:hypothetical protein GJAV_G00000380 [Gymnothorax javanicus]|nr:hypothetical protein GJAV_G00000380 [Gymnothorax javanicus]
MFSPHQETLIVNMVHENNTIKLKFSRRSLRTMYILRVSTVSASTVRVLKHNRPRMEPLYRERFERNSESKSKDSSVYRVSTGCSGKTECIYMDEAGFNLTKRRRGHSVIGQRAIVGVPGQRGGNVTVCCHQQSWGCHHHANLGPYNTHQLLIFLNHMRDALFGQQDERPIYVWDNEFSEPSRLEWFNMNQGFINLCLHCTPLS